jgi:phosphatidylserine/phosphatidylglycerophosphate/cardiolipin synthase-like enzyme
MIAVGLIALYLLTAVHHVYKPLPEGLSAAGPYRPVDRIAFLADATWLDGAGRQHTELEIFDRALRMIGEAESLVVADFFLVNQFAGAANGGHRPLSRELVDALAQRRETVPGLRALLISDPFNTLYGGVKQPLFERLDSAGIGVIETDLRALRDPNPAWSAAWRICCQWLGNSPRGGWLPNPVGETPVSLRTYLALVNFKANHRKTLVTDSPDGWVGLVTSGNPHDASSRHDNIAVYFRGAAALDLLQTELAVAAFSGGTGIPAPEREPGDASGGGGTELRVLTESRIRDAALDMIHGAGEGDQLDLFMFYLSHRGVVKALAAAQRRGVALRVLLDPNRDAFGREKNGIPNRQVAMELHRAGVPVRWCNTAGEQCHAKMLLRRDRDGTATLLAGSANFTRRNLDDFNLETNVQVRADSQAPVMADAGAFFDARWENEPDRVHNLPYAAYADHSRLRYWRYRFMEMSGLSSF